MADKGTVKAFADTHEAEVAKAYGGEVTRGSGQTWQQKGDVLLKGDTLIECKLKGTPGGDAVNSVCIKLADFHKLYDEATNKGLGAAMALRVYNPLSPLANDQGWVDFALRPVADDVEREWKWNE